MGGTTRLDRSPEPAAPEAAAVGRRDPAAPQALALLRGPAPGAVLALQRTAGNAAVGRLVARTPQSDTLAAMQATAGYRALSAADRKRMDVLIGGGSSISAHAWGPMKALLDARGTDKSAAATFTGFLSGGSWLNFDARLPGEQRRAAATYTTDAAVDVTAHPFKSGAADAKKTVVKVQGTWPDGTAETQSVPIFSPKTFTPPAPGRVLPSVADMAKVVAELPMQSRAAIKRVDLNPAPNPDDAIWQADPNYNPTGATFVSHMSAGADGIVKIYPSAANADLKEIETSLTHETGHTVSNSAWGNVESDPKWDRWKQARTADGIAVSKYGKSSNREDFAESWLLFTTAYGTPLEAEIRTLIPNRCTIMDEFMAHKATPPAAAAPAVPAGTR